MLFNGRMGEEMTLFRIDSIIEKFGSFKYSKKLGNLVKYLEQENGKKTSKSSDVYILANCSIKI